MKAVPPSLSPPTPTKIKQPNSTTPNIEPPKTKVPSQLPIPATDIPSVSRPRYDRSAPAKRWESQRQKQRLAPPRWKTQDKPPKKQGSKAINRPANSHKNPALPQNPKSNPQKQKPTPTFRPIPPPTKKNLLIFAAAQPPKLTKSYPPISQTTENPIDSYQRAL